MQKEKQSRAFDNAISFLSGIIFYNAVMTLLQGQILVSAMSFAAVIVAFSAKRFFDWTTEESG